MAYVHSKTKQYNYSNSKIGNFKFCTDWFVYYTAGNVGLLLLLFFFFETSKKSLRVNNKDSRDKTDKKAY